MTDAPAPFFWIDNHNAVIGTSDSGKTWTAKWGVEEMLRQRRHTLIIDPLGVWYGLRSSADGAGAGFDVPIFGGPRGDVAIRPTDGAAIGGIVIDQRVSAIVDLSQIYSGPEQRLFVRDLVARLRRRTEKANFHFVVDEADEFIPEKTRDDVAFALQEDMLWIAKKGRSSGWVQTLITQRTADVSKSSLSMSQTIIAHQLISPQDQKPFLDYVRKRGTKADLDAIEAKLASLQQGERYLYSPRAHVLTLERTPAISTFDSSSTPPAGESRREPRTLAQLDVSAIAAALAPKPVEIETTIEIIGEQRRPGLVTDAGRVAVLEAHLRDRDQRIAELEEINAELDAECRRWVAGIGDIDRLIRQVQQGTSPAQLAGEPDSRVAHAPSAKGAAAALPGSGPGPAHLPAPEIPQPKRVLPRVAAEGGAPLAVQPGSEPAAGGASTDREYRSLAVLASVYPAGLSEPAWAARAGRARKGGAWLRQRKRYIDGGLIEQRDGRWFATDAGTAAAGAEIPDMPPAGPALIGWWAERLGAPGRLLKVLAAVHPRALTRDGLAGEVGMAPRGGAFLRHVTDLKKSELVTETGKRLAIAPSLMGDE